MVCSVDVVVVVIVKCGSAKSPWREERLVVVEEPQRRSSPCTAAASSSTDSQRAESTRNTRQLPREGPDYSLSSGAARRLGVGKNEKMLPFASTLRSSSAAVAGLRNCSWQFETS